MNADAGAGNARAGAASRATGKEAAPDRGWAGAGGSARQPARPGSPKHPANVARSPTPPLPHSPPTGANARTQPTWDAAKRTGPRPTSTYRLQLGPDVTLAEAKDLVPYLDALGVSHLYLSPILAAREGSTHGYDVTDPGRLNPGLGTEDDLRALADALHQRGMGILLDIVPNHMAADAANPWWADVLRQGRESEYAHYFDIDWDAAGGKLVLPVLGKPLDGAIADHEIQLRAEDGHLHFAYYDHRFPLSPETEAAALAPFSTPEHAATALNPAAPEDAAPAGHPADPPRSENTPRTQRPLRTSPTPPLPHSPFLSLAGLLATQHYRLTDWRRGARAINYRRFFDITGLVAIRVEEPDVFDAVHARVLAWAREGVVDALRIDHVDGLRDPAGYLQRLRAALPGAWILVEKILARGEHLPDDWPVDGTTGYDTLNMLNGLFIDPEGLAKLRRTWHEHTGLPEDFDALAYEKKRMVLETLFPAELEGLLSRLEALAEADPEAPRSGLRDALVAITAALPVYRTYTRTDGDVSAADRAAIEAAAAANDPVAAAVDWLRRVLLMEAGGSDPEARLEFVARWQQLTGPVMAKGVEDTALFVDSALLSACEVGADPGRAAVSVEEYDAFMRHLAARTPLTLTAASTHDTKRGEDVRARLNVLSRIPDEWADRLARWREWNAELASASIAPDDEIRLYQTLLGTWPPADDGEGLAVPPPADYAGRVKRFMRKAAREAKLHTSWRNPDPAYEEALARFTDALLARAADDPFMKDFLEFAAKVARAGVANSIAQTVLRLGGPGIPDIYQGAELWALTMVDPDNRRPVDRERRRALLDSLESGEEVPEKLRQTARMLRLRRGAPPAP